MKKTLLVLPALLVLAGCDDLPDNKSGSGNTAPGVVNMKFLGTAQAGPGEPINGCRVYGFSVNGDTQTAVMCGNKVTVASGSKKHDDGGDAGGSVDD